MRTVTNKFPPEVAEKLRSYVYMYVDPRSGKPFYIGKGVGNRVFSHLDDNEECAKVDMIKAIRKAGRQPEIEILRFGLSDDQASLIEASAIDLIGIPTLTNRVRGQHSRSFGRVKVRELLLQLTAKPAKIKHRAVLITINQLYRSDMSSQELLEATRGIWKLGKRREDPEIAMAVYQGIVREVYRIKRWRLPAGTLPYRTRDRADVLDPTRWEFDAEVAEEKIRKQYVDKSVGKSGQNPIRYFNC